MLHLKIINALFYLFETNVVHFYSKIFQVNFWNFSFVDARIFCNLTTFWSWLHWNWHPFYYSIWWKIVNWRVSQAVFYGWWFRWFLHLLLMRMKLAMMSIVLKVHDFYVFLDYLEMQHYCLSCEGLKCFELLF